MAIGKVTQSQKQKMYRYEAINPIASTSTLKEGEDDVKHFSAFSRTYLGPASPTSEMYKKRLPQVSFFDEDVGMESDSSLSSLSSANTDSEEEDPDITPKAINKFRESPSRSTPKQTSANEIFSLGDVVYIDSNLTRPFLGVLTDILTSSEEGDGDNTRGEEIICKLRFLYWPQDVSQVTSNKLSRLVDNDEVYYTHQAPRFATCRRTKNSSRGGDGSEGLKDDFEYGPSLLNTIIEAKSILGKVTMHSSAKECRKATASTASSPSKRQNSVFFKRKLMPSNLFIKRAIDPQREVFWNVDWDAVAQRGKSNGKWDLIEGDDEIQGRIQYEMGNDDKVTPSPLTTPGKNANEWAKMLAKERGVSLNAILSKDPQAMRRMMEEKRIAALLDTPSKRRQRRMKEKEQSQRPTKRARLNRRKSGNYAYDESEMSSVESNSDLSQISDEDDSVTSATSDEEFGEDSEAESMLDIDDELFMDEEDDFDWDSSVRKTPKKRTKRMSGFAPSTPRKFNSPVKAMATPRSKMRILGTVSLAPTTLPARPKALDAFSIKELQNMSAQQRAKRLLHVGATPESLPCRQDQFEEVMACLKDAVEDGVGGCVYVSGVPGTGKTATVREVIRDLQKRSEQNEISPFNFVEINGMKLQDAHDAYGVLWHALTGIRSSNANALHQLSQHFGSRQRNTNKLINQLIQSNSSLSMGPGRATTVVLMDELDQMVTTRQDVMYNMFNWPNTADSRLVVVAIANTMDLPERILHAKVASRLGMTRITFKPYNDRELVEIVHARLGMKQNEEKMTNLTSNTQGCQDVFASEALVYVAKRVSNVSGDARRMLDVCRRAIDIVEEECTQKVDNNPGNVRPVTIGDIKRVLDAMVKSGKGAHISHLSLHNKMAIVAILASVRRAGKAEIDLGMISTTHANLCRMHAIDLPNEKMKNHHFISNNIHQVLFQEDDPGRLNLMANSIDQLCSLGLVIAVGTGAAAARSGRFVRYVLACGEDEVRLALEQDEDTRLRNLL